MKFREIKEGLAKDFAKGVGQTASNVIDKLQAKTGMAGMADLGGDNPDDEKGTKKDSQVPELRKLKTGSYFLDKKNDAWIWGANDETWTNYETKATIDKIQGYNLFNKAKPNRRHVAESVIIEGGNIWPEQTTDFDHKDIPTIMKTLNSVIVKTGTKALPIGSGATPTPGKRSGDLDMIIDSGKLKEFFGVKDDKTARIELEKLFQDAGLDTAKTGTSVHVKVPVGDEFHQVDVMVVPDGEIAQKFHVHDIPKGSSYKGKHKQIAIAYLAKEKGLKWSPYKGLVNRETNELVTNDLDEIAKTIIGPNATGKDLGSIESIAQALPDNGKQMMADLENDAGFNK